MPVSNGGHKRFCLRCICSFTLFIMWSVCCGRTNHVIHSCPLSPLEFWQIRGTLFWGPYNEDPATGVLTMRILLLGNYIRSPYLRKLPYRNTFKALYKNHPLADVLVTLLLLSTTTVSQEGLSNVNLSHSCCEWMPANLCLVAHEPACSSSSSSSSGIIVVVAVAVAAAAAEIVVMTNH